MNRIRFPLEEAETEAGVGWEAVAAMRCDGGRGSVHPLDNLRVVLWPLSCEWGN